jgi:NAD+ synthase
MKDKIVAWLKEQLRITGKEGFVVGVSGGIDSAVTSALCKLATDQVLGYVLHAIEKSIGVNYVYQKNNWLCLCSGRFASQRSSATFKKL